MVPVYKRLLIINYSRPCYKLITIGKSYYSTLCSMVGRRSSSMMFENDMNILNIFLSMFLSLNQHYFLNIVKYSKHSKLRKNNKALRPYLVFGRDLFESSTKTF